MDSAGELFGVVGVFAAFLFRERVPEVRDGFVGFVVGDFTRSRRSARAGLLVEFGEQCDVGRIVPQPALPSTTRYPFSSTLIQSTAAMRGSAGEKGPGGRSSGWGMASSRRESSSSASR